MSMKRYRVRPGFRFGAFDEVAAGEIVELAEGEAKGFADKLEGPLPDETPAPPATPIVPVEGTTKK